MLGGNDWIYFNGPGFNAVSLYATGNVWDAVRGAAGAVTLNGAQASVLGGGDWIYFSRRERQRRQPLRHRRRSPTFVIGSYGAVTLNDAQAYVSGMGNYIYLNGSANLLAFAPQIGSATIFGFASTDVLQFSKSDFADFAALHPVQLGDDTVIGLDAAHAVTLSNVTASSLTSAQFAFA